MAPNTPSDRVPNTPSRRVPNTQKHNTHPSMQGRTAELEGGPEQAHIAYHEPLHPGDNPGANRWFL